MASNLSRNVPVAMLARAWVPGLHGGSLGWEVLGLGVLLAEHALF